MSPNQRNRILLPAAVIAMVLTGALLTGRWLTGLGANTKGGEVIFVAVASGTNEGAASVDGEHWIPTILPSVQSWSSVASGGGRFVAVSDSDTAAY